MDRIQNLRLEPLFHFFSLYAPDLLQIMIHWDVVREYKFCFCEVQVGVSQAGVGKIALAINQLTLINQCN